MTQSGYTSAIVDAMLSWLKGVASWFLKLFNLSGGFSPLKFLADNWKQLLIIFLIVGVVVDLLVWLVRWRPHWIWFRKKRVIINDKNFFSGKPEKEENARQHAQTGVRAAEIRRPKENWKDSDYVIYGNDRRDYFIRVVYGARVSLLVGLFASLIVLVIGLLYGSISGYAGGKVDLVMMRVVDIIYSLPDTLMVILLSVVLNQIMGDALKGTVFAKIGNNMISLFVVFGLLYWVGMARLIRGQILSIKTNEYVLAARAMGAKPGRIIRKHILPNCMSVIFVSVALQIPSAIFTESFLSFIGLGVQAPMPSLGSLANAARGGMQSYPFKMVFPAIGICLIVLSFNLLGDGLRDAFDPKLRR